MPRSKNWKKLIIDKAGDNIKIFNIENIQNRNSYIKFICLCGNKSEKRVRAIIEYSGFNCNECTNINKKKKIEKTNLKKYGVVNPFQSEIIKKKIVKTNLKKYGYKYTMMDKNKREKIFLEKYGVINPFQLESVKEKIKNTNREKYGVDYPMQLEWFMEKTKKTNIKNHNGKHNLQLESTKKQIEKTNLKKYGVRHPMQNIEIYKKNNSYKRKNYQFNCGNIVKIQGFENWALDLLQAQGYKFEDIKIEGIRIDYIFENKKRVHIPDIYIPHENLIIEVKSDWTYKRYEKKNLIKQKTSIEKGFKYEFWIFNKDGILTIQ